MYIYDLNDSIVVRNLKVKLSTSIIILLLSPPMRTVFL